MSLITLSVITLSVITLSVVTADRGDFAALSMLDLSAAYRSSVLDVHERAA